MTSNDLFRTVESRYGRLTIFANDSGAVSQSLVKYGEWAENELSFLRAMINVGATVVDVGAYIGTHALAFSRFVGSAGHVIAIEAQARSFAVLKGNIEANAVGNVRLEHAIASSETGQATISPIDIEHSDSFGSVSVRDALPSTSGGGAENAKPRADGDLTVRVTTIDSLEIGDCALIKIDVEGAEDFVLRGAAQTIRRRSPIIYAECNSLEHGLKTVEVLRAFGYRVLAHVVFAYNSDNFRGDSENTFGGAREVALVGVAGHDIERIARYQVRSCELLIDIETADDLALALLNKPQYAPEVLRAGAAARSGGETYLDEAVSVRRETERLRDLEIHRRKEMADKQERLDRTDDALAEMQRLAVERGREIERTEAALAQVQRLALERAEEIEQLREKAENSILQAGLARQEANRLRDEASELKLENERAQQQSVRERERAVGAEANLDRVYRSTSWRLSAPGRALATLLRGRPVH
jgi:FkbM family methyltransferase